MRDTDLFRMALGIEPRWMATKSDFDAAAKRLDIHLDFARGSRFACPECTAARSRSRPRAASSRPALEIARVVHAYELDHRCGKSIPQRLVFPFEDCRLEPLAVRITQGL